MAITARREAKLQAVAAGLRERHGVAVHVFTVDHADPASAARLCEELAARGLTVDALVNNAGYGVPGLYNAVEWQVHEDFLRVMVAGVCELTYRLMPGMVGAATAASSTSPRSAGFVPAPAGHALYGASKAFPDQDVGGAGTRGQPHGVQVTALCPGFTLSEFHDVTGTREQMRGMPGWMWMDAATVAQQGYDAVMAGKAIHITGRVNRAVALAVRYVPQWLVKIVGRRMAKSYRKT